MKKILLLTFLLASSSLLYGQYYYLHPFIPGNPGGLNDLDAEGVVGGTLPTSWTVLLAGNQPVPAWSQVNSIPFNFNFNGSSVSQYKVSSSGVQNQPEPRKSSIGPGKPHSTSREKYTIDPPLQAKYRNR